MERYEAYQPPAKKGFYLDPRTKILFMAFVTTLMFFVYENLAMDAVVAIIPLTLLLINRQVRTALIYGGLFALAVVAKLTQGMYVLPSVLNMISVLLVAMVIRLFPIFMLSITLLNLPLLMNLWPLWRNGTSRRRSSFPLPLCFGSFLRWVKNRLRSRTPCGCVKSSLEQRSSGRILPHFWNTG